MPLPTTLAPVNWGEQAANAVAASVFFALTVTSFAVRVGAEQQRLLRAFSYTLGSLFAYGALEVASNVWRVPPLAWCSAAAAMLAALSLSFLVSAFVGQRRPARSPWLRFTTVYFGALAVGSLLPFVLPSWSAFPGGKTWAALALVGILLVTVRSGVLLGRHASRSDPLEKMRSYAFVAALAIGVLGVAVDLLSLLSLSELRLSAVGLALSALVVAALLWRLEIFGNVSRLWILVSTALGLALVVGVVALVGWSRGSLAWTALGVMVLALLGTLLQRHVLSVSQEAAARVKKHALLGRFAAQMAHDIKNPAAAIRGAAQFLLGDVQRPEHQEFLQLIVDQTDRLAEVVDTYQRLSEVRVVHDRVALEPMILEVIAQQRAWLHGVSDHPTLAIELVAKDGRADGRANGRGRVEVLGDVALLRSALENIVRNGIEAILQGGTRGPHRVEVEIVSDVQIGVVVRDTGPGFSARVAAQAGEDFFTTKAQGTGLGLGFVRRVAEAHGGTLELGGNPNGGGKVTLWLAAPRDSEAF